MSQAPFVPQLLLGADHIRTGDRVAIRDFIRLMLAHRGFPLHINSLWNALYFDWTPDDGYVALPTERIEYLRFREAAPAVPVGGFVMLESGSGRDALAEVVYKERRGLALDTDGTVLAADHGVPPPGAARREALTLDWCAFGEPGDATRALIAKLQRRMVRLDSLQHAPVESLDAPDDADLDDAARYARYLFTRHRTGLLGEFVEDGTTDDGLYAALLTSLRAVADIAGEMPDLLSWNGYFLLRADYDAMLADGRPESPAGRAFLEHICDRVAFMPPQAHRPILTAMRPLVASWFDRGGDVSGHASLEGTGYHRLACLANAHIAARLREAGDRVVRGAPGHLRLDAPGDWGGVWLCQPIGTSRPAWTRLPPLIPLGLAEADLPDASEAEAALAADRDVDPAPTLRGSQLHWAFALRPVSFAAGEFPLAGAGAYLDPDAPSVRLRVGLADEPSPLVDALVPLDREAGVLRDVDWPLDFYPGIRLAAWVERGGQVVRATATRLAVPLRIGGFVLPYDLDEVIYRRATGSDTPLDSHALRGAESLSELVGRAFHRRGERVDEQTYALRLHDLAVALLGPSPSAEDTRPLLAELRRMGLQRDAGGRFLWSARRIPRRARVADRELLAAYGETVAGRRRTAGVRAQVVRMHLRRWEHKHAAARAERERAYVIALARAGAAHRLAPALPPGFTFVQGYEKGRDGRPDAG